MESTKQCPKCNQELQRSEFYAQKSNKDGLQAYCKSCQKESNKARATKLKITPHLSRATQATIDADITVFQPRQLIARLRELGYTGGAAIHQ